MIAAELAELLGKKEERQVQKKAMKNIIIGTAGHIDHGKTTLIKALTGRNTDRWEEEQRRGITIDLGFTGTGEIHQKHGCRSWRNGSGTPGDRGG